MRLIDAEEILRKCNGGNCWYIPREAIEEAPTVDAVPVVRCKGCRWWEDMYGNGVKGYCHACKHGYHSPTWEIGIRRTTAPDFYCGDGERKEE